MNGSVIIIVAALGARRKTFSVRHGRASSPVHDGGTSIPGLMTRLESLGGFRMTNWDIARAVRLIPSGMPITWQ